MVDLMIVGSGPGGVAAAAYGLHLGLTVRLIGPELGGKINYPFSIRGLENVDTVHGVSMVRSFAAKVPPESHVADVVDRLSPTGDGFTAHCAGGTVVEARSLVVATGARPRRLHVPGEQEYWGKGLSYSAVSHAPLFAGREVAVIGSDRRAQIAALELVRVAARVIMIAPLPDQLDPRLQQRLEESRRVERFTGWEVSRFDGDRFLQRLALVSHVGAQREIPIEGAFVTMGLLPNSDFVRDLVERTPGGRIQVNENAQSSHPAIFAAGDVSSVYGEQVPIALGEGIKAALSASAYLAGEPAVEERVDE